MRAQGKRVKGKGVDVELRTSCVNRARRIEALACRSGV
jgi:hypothetical protein